MTSKTLRNLALGATLATAVALPLSFANAEPELVGAVVGKTADDIRATLTTQGYEVRKVKPEDGKLEAYALKGDKLYEIYVDGTTGTVSKVKEAD